MPKTITKTVYEFHELSERAKQRVKEWLNEGSGPDDYDFVTEDFKTIARAFGFEVQDNRRQQAAIYWTSHPWSAGFCAVWRLADAQGVCAKLRDHLGDPEKYPHELHDLAARFEGAMAQLILRAERVAREGELRSQVAGNEHGPQADLNLQWYDVGVKEGSDEEIAIFEFRDKFEELVKDLGHWLAKNIEEEHDHHWSDDYVRETCEANEYLFDEDGCIVR